MILSDIINTQLFSFKYFHTSGLLLNKYSNIISYYTITIDVILENIPCHLLNDFYCSI